ncbi:uncharacterized protein N7479_003305 [Penicillium vulpinum]|uniref:Methyltransferase type 11 domain-containing protein n=1 Tax=Penicillium vulpinum TaxID=29845 RepID=A0A1V6S354_9EURO|nr:uncharacterized protein N7479_003305 [Penicillium vulpinum]KAJ5963429.1 hypothetical protein N7479_003305 [Penicillium vulpinum]OQE08471.1 hypothetical protein PENVUL_c009G07772 [Penicillium vulpinum]
MDKQTGITARLDLDTQQLASQYDVLSDFQYELGVFLIRMLDISPSERVLDIGAGTGRLTSHVADFVGEEGWAIGIDPLKDRIDVARKKIQPNLSFFVGDAHDLSRFDSGTLDVVFMNCVFHWLRDETQVLSECARVLKPGGRLGISAMSRNHPFRPYEIKKFVLSTDRYRDYSESANRVIKYFTENELGNLLDESGFARRTISPHSGMVTCQDSQGLLDLLRASSFGNFLGHLPEELQVTASYEIQEKLDRLRTGEGMSFELVSLIALAIKD